MVEKKLSQKEKDLQFIDRKIKQIEKFGVDISNIPRLNKRHGQAKIHDLRLHLEKNTNYQFTKLKTSSGEIVGHVSKAEMLKLKNEAVRFLEAGGFVKKGFTYEGKRKVVLYQYNKSQMTVNQLATYMASIGKAQEKIGKVNEAIDVTKQAYQIFAEELGMKDPIKNTQGDESVPKMTNIKSLEGQKGRELIDHEIKEAMKFDMNKMRQEIYGDTLSDIASIWGYDSDIYQRLSELDYTDLEILRSMFNNDNEFYATMYGSDGQGDRSEDIRRERGDRLGKKLDELDKLRTAKEEYLNQREMTLGGRN